MPYPITPLIGVKPGEKNDEASKFKLGTTFTGDDSLIRIYAKAAGAIAAGATVTIDPVTFEATAGAGGYTSPDFALVAGDEAWFTKSDAGASGAPSSVSWDSITGKPSTFAPTIGTTATTAKAGNYTPPAATTSAAGIVRQAATQANSTATDVAGLVSDFNGLLAKLKAAGLMA
ncbi:head fiber protein [Brucella sp. IR073]|uniref:head fiber protein n=1 Tax=unclassified Brucella TaxID=2632610 RepID=UPI003B97F461